MILYIILASILIKNVNYFDVSKWDWIKANVLIKKEKLIVGSEEKKADYVINGEDKYLFPGNYDLAVFLYGSPAGNIWEDEFTPEVQSKARNTLLYSGTSEYAILGAWDDEEELNHGTALGPWILYPGVSPLTPYKLENWNPFVFISFKIGSSEDIPRLLEKLHASSAGGVILPLPDDSTFSKNHDLLIEITKKLRENDLKIYGYSINRVSRDVLISLHPDIVIGWIPDTILEDIKVLPLFFDTLTVPNHLIPPYYKLSLEPYYSFLKVGISDYSLIEMVNSHNTSKLGKVPLPSLLFGSGSGFIGRYFGYALVSTIQKWLSSGIPPDSVWKVILVNNGKILHDTTPSLILYAENPMENPEILLSPLLIIRGRRVIFPPEIEYKINTILPGELPIGKPDLIVDFSSDSTLWGTEWKNSNLGFGLTGKWDRNCIVGRLVSDPQNAWSSGQVINFEKRFGEGFDLSPFRALKIKFAEINCPIEISLLSKFSYTPLKVRLSQDDSVALIDLNTLYSRGVQGVKISPAKFGTDSYRICLKSISTVRDTNFYEKLAEGIYRRIEVANQLGDTTMLLKIYKNLKVLNAISKKEKFLYLLAYVDYRLIPLTGSRKKQLQLIKEALAILEKLENIEARILEYSLRGYEMGLSPLKAIFGGAKMNRLKKLLEEKASGNPRAYLVMGISKLYTPSMYGGSVDKAIEFFKKSIELFEAQSDSNPPYSWGYPDALVFLTIAYRKKGMIQEALPVAEELNRKFPYYVFGYMQYLTLK